MENLRLDAVKYGNGEYLHYNDPCIQPCPKVSINVKLA
jgi:hypothetical protein